MITAFNNIMQPGTETIKVATAICIPSRKKITGTLKPYHIKHSIEGEETIRDDDGYPLYGIATVRVNSKAAVWAEYVLLRSGKFELRSKPKDARNAQWATKYGGRLPTPWDVMSGKAQPYLDPECTHDPETGKKLTKKKRVENQYTPPSPKRSQRSQAGGKGSHRR